MKYRWQTTKRDLTAISRSTSWMWVTSLFPSNRVPKITLSIGRSPHHYPLPPWVSPLDERNCPSLESHLTIFTHAVDISLTTWFRRYGFAVQMTWRSTNRLRSFTCIFPPVGEESQNLHHCWCWIRSHWPERCCWQPYPSLGGMIKCWDYILFSPQLFTPGIWL